MRSPRHAKLKLLALSSCAVLALATASQAAEAARFEIAGGDLKAALQQFAGQSPQEILFSSDVVAGRRTGGVSAQADAPTALAQLLRGTGLTYRQTETGTLLIVQDEGSGPQGGSAGGDVDALIVTAQKREENIQDVPIAISAFTQEDLTTRQVAGGPDLITQVPNMTFTKTNFSSYSIQIRGIGTQAISATTDPAVAVAFNNTPFIRNRFFEQEFYDLERIEVLRGPQGTLYGRNATAGVVNIISAKPRFNFEAKGSADVSNYHSSRIEGMVNIPLVEDAVALRLAGAWTKRDGYAHNQITDSPIDGRDLWSTRMSLRFAPTDALDVNLIWEHFQEDDDRLRSGKQTCKKHVVTHVGNVAVDYTDRFGGGANGEYIQEGLSQGCERNSLYDSQSFQTPNGFALPFYYPVSRIGLPRNRSIPNFDPYLSTVQSTDLRVIESTVDPEYTAKADLFELQVNLDLTDTLTLASETSYNSDFIFSMQDFNRFNTTPDAWADELNNGYPRENVINDGVFCDPQIGCSDRLVGIDLSTAKSRQFSQEFRLSSNFDGPLNFSLGANFLRYDTEDKYYVFINALSMFAAISPYRRLPSDNLSPYVPGVTDNSECLVDGRVPPPPGEVQSVTSCIYMDSNSIHSLNDEGHNYFLSKNPFKLISYAAFGEIYYNIADNLKLTGGLRWTVDKKEAPISPSWLLASETVGYPVAEVIEQEWREPTGRVTLDWKPELGFTDDTMIYASYAHGYKAGGANPPRPGLAIYSELPGEIEATQKKSATHPKTFEPEFIDAFEIGAKNVLLDGKVTANIAAFYYDYEGYQISEIVNRSALNRNFDATVWGVEFETDWRPLDNLRLGFKGGYQKTRLADGSHAIDLMDRTAGNPDWVVRRPFPTFPANCILPVYTIIGNPAGGAGGSGPPQLISHGNPSGGASGGCEIAYVLGYDPVTNLPYVPDPTVQGSFGRLGYFDDYPGFNPLDESLGHNGGEGFFKDLSGNDLPNAPNYTATLTVDYTLPLANDWLMTLHSDYHWQSESWWRVFNDHEYNRLKSFSTVNLAAIFTNEEAGWHIMAYVKNVTDETAITGAFLNSDDTMLTTNVFLTEPRLYGLRVTKAWSGGSLLGGFSERRDTDKPYPFTVELGGQLQRHDAPNAPLRPSFAGVFSPALDIFHEPQAKDLDWGDGRSVRVTWRPDGGPWSASASVRYGKTNGSGGRSRAEEGSSDPACFVAIPTICAAYLSAPPSDSRREAKRELAAATRPNWSEAWSNDREEHQVIDFEVGREFSLGGFSRSALGVGLRYAEFKSTTHLGADGIPDWDIADGWLATRPATHHRYQGTLDADRRFEGVGPVANWAAAHPIASGGFGRVDLDWSVSGGVLFGRQEALISEVEDESFYRVTGLGVPHAFFVKPATVEPTKFTTTSRNTSVTVPVVDLSLGLSYTIDRMSVGAGYRWERYFDVIDGGHAGPESHDRTIDGPYVKIAVGFGG